ncbi:MAG: RAMP superfamily CRISPR-associated protein [Promethearchaeota archaeon]
MSYDLFANFDATKEEGIKQVLNKPEFDIMTRIRLLAATHVADASEKYRQQVGIKELGRDAYQEMVHNEYGEVTYYENFCSKQLKLMKSIELIPNDEVFLEKMPNYSACIQFSFILAKPYISKDDANFYIVDNAIKKEKVFKVPMISAATWKGNLRNAAIQNLMNNDSLSAEEFIEKRFRLSMLFGDEGRDDDDDSSSAIAKYLNDREHVGYSQKLKNYYFLKPDAPMPNHSGRLSFFPTYFDRIDLEVINPHSRETKVGTNPIIMECVPKGCVGFFQLLYLPFEFYFLTVDQDEKSKKVEMFRDLKLIIETINTMFLESGFGAKSSAGFGIAHRSFQKTDNEKFGGVIKVKSSNGKIIRCRMGNFSAMQVALQKIAEKLEVEYE